MHTAFEEMFPYGENPLEPTFKKQSFQLYDQIQNPTISKTDELPFFCNFPSPFFDEHELPLNQIFPTFTASRPANPTPEKASPKPKLKPAAPPRRRGGGAAAAPRKRTCKKDRHSKICTAQGIRDRRMRLSLQVARKFFDLQDLLGYDKASKTIEWLFTKSKTAIKELAAARGGGGGDVSLSESEECEVMSGIEENCSINEGLKTAAVEAAAEEEEEEGDGSLEKKGKKTANTRESREKARARARCRTEEKMMGKRVEDPSTAAFNGGGGDLVHQQPSDVGTIEKLLGNSWDPNTNFMGFLGNWDLISSNQASISMAEGNPISIFSATAPDFPLFHQ